MFLPWTLEMGSWAWVRKNPLQVFQALGFFNPIKPHRYARTMRRHARLVEFLWSVLLVGRKILILSGRREVELTPRSQHAAQIFLLETIFLLERNIFCGEKNTA